MATATRIDNHGKIVTRRWVTDNVPMGANTRVSHWPIEDPGNRAKTPLSLLDEIGLDSSGPATSIREVLGMLDSNLAINDQTDEV